MAWIFLQYEILLHLEVFCLTCSLVRNAYSKRNKAFHSSRHWPHEYSTLRLERLIHDHYQGSCASVVAHVAFLMIL